MQATSHEERVEEALAIMSRVDDESQRASLLAEASKMQAMAGRVILRFPHVAIKIGNIHVPDGRRLRPELGELVHCGAALNEEQRVLRDEIIERAKAGHRFLVSVATGTYYWREEMGPEFEYLKDVRTYRITEIATSVALDGEP